MCTAAKQLHGWQVLACRVDCVAAEAGVSSMISNIKRRTAAATLAHEEAEPEVRDGEQHSGSRHTASVKTHIHCPGVLLHPAMLEPDRLLPTCMSPL